MIQVFEKIRKIRSSLNPDYKILNELRKLSELRKKSEPHVETVTGDAIDLRTETLADNKQRKTYLQNFINNKFSVDGFYYMNLDEDSKNRVNYYFQNL